MPSVVSGGLARRLMVVAIVVAAAGCGDDDGDASEPATASAEASAAAGVATSAGEGDAVLPADFPIDQVAEPTAGALRSGSGAAPGPWVLIYAVDGDLEAAVSAYRDALTADGFTVDDAAEVAGLVSSFAAAGNELRVTVLGSPAAGETSAGMIVTVEQAP